MKSKLVKIGNSLGVRLPREALTRAGFAPERPVSIKVARGRITLITDVASLAEKAREQSLRVSHRRVGKTDFWESLADDDGWQ